MPNFQKIIDILSGALSILDFSYIISGATTFLIILFSLHLHGVDLSFLEGRWVICILLAYVAGLITWSIGRLICKMIRDFFQTFDSTFEKYKCLIICEVNGTIRSYTNEQLYTFLWVELAKKSPERANFINRYWVMQAVYEGLFASCIVAVIATFDLHVSMHELLGNYALILIFLLLIFACILFISAREQEAYQIKEVIMSYKSYCLSDSNCRDTA